MNFKNLKPWLTEFDCAYLEQSLKDCTEYLEFGSGGSTLLADKLCNRVTSVETDKSFIDGLLPYCRRTKFIYVDFGDVVEYGHLKTKFVPGIDYYTQPFSRGANPDLILIDGRFRIATLSYCLLTSKPGTKILFDDFQKSRYECLKKFPIPFRQLNEMCEFISPEIKLVQLYNYMKEYDKNSQ